MFLQLSAHVVSAAFRRGSSSWAQASGTSSHDGQIHLHPCSVGATVLRYKWMLPASLPASLWCVWCSLSPTSFQNKSGAVLWVWYLHLSWTLFEYMNSVIHKWGWDVSKTQYKFEWAHIKHCQQCRWCDVPHEMQPQTGLSLLSWSWLLLDSSASPSMRNRNNCNCNCTCTKVRIITLITEKGKGKVCPSQRRRWEESMTSSIILP